MNQIISLINDTRNPFSDGIDQDHLFNIASGKPESPDTTSFLLDIVRIGKEARERFIEECVEDDITRQKLKTFVTEGKKFTLRSKDK